MVLVELDSSYIDYKPIKNYIARELCQANLILWEWVMAIKVVYLQKHDDEAPMDWKKLIWARCKLQLVLPDTHQVNIAKLGMQTLKRQFESILIGVDESFPMTLWDRLLP